MTRSQRRYMPCRSAVDIRRQSDCHSSRRVCEESVKLGMRKGARASRWFILDKPRVIERKITSDGYSDKRMQGVLI